MPSKQVTIPQIGTVSIYKRRKAKNIRLSITNDGKVRVTLPYWTPYQAGVAFVQAKSEWVLSKLPPAVVLHDGQRIGKAHTLRLYKRAANSRPTSRIAERIVHVYYPLHIEPHHEAVQKAAHRASIRALKLEAERLLPQRLRTLAELHCFTFSSVEIRSLKSRWGSCSHRAEITLNCYLMNLPWHLIDYVLLHELTHTKIMAHGSPFWEELARVIPNAHELRREIRSFRPMLGNYEAD